MKVSRRDLEKSQIELTVELEAAELQPYISQGATALSKEIKIEGFRPGKVPLEILQQKIGEMAILEEAARILINKQVYLIIEEQIKDRQVIGQPEINITKLAPGNPLEYKITVTTLPELKLGAYKDLAIENPEIKVEDKELNKVIDDLLEMRASEKISDEAIKDGDKVIASVNLFLDNVPVEDGQNPETTILIGKNYFVQGFDKNLIGLKKGDAKNFTLSYPKGHWQANLSGKRVEFKVKIKEIYNRQVPELNDELAKAFRFKNAAELKDNINKSILEQKKQEAEQKLELEIIDKIINNSKFGDIADNLIRNEADIMLRELEQNVSSQGGNFADYLKSIGKSTEQLILEMMPNATKRVKSTVIFREIAHLEKITVSDKDLNKELDLLRARYEKNPEVLKNLDNPAYHSYLSSFLLNQKVVDNLKKWNLIKK